MLNIILPPIVISSGIAFLIWMFVRKKRMAANPVKEPVISETVAHKKKRSRNAVQRIMRRRIAAFKNGVRASLASLKRSVQNMRERRHAIMTSRRKEDLNVLEIDHDALSGTSPKKKKRSSPKSTDIASSHSEEGVIDLPQERQLDPAQAKKDDQFENILIERIAMNPRDIEAYERLGDHYIEWKQYNDAKECYKQVLRLSPMNRRARIRMRRLEKVLGKRH